MPLFAPSSSPLGKHPFEAVRANLVVTPILYVRELRHRKVKLLIQSHAASQLLLSPGYG